jgi:peptidoglycan/xylan/chitin deacetylase (PgdA/CDA1 family)
MANERQHRRTFLRGAGLAAAALAGCISQTGGDEATQTGTPAGATATQTRTAEATETATATETAAEPEFAHDWFLPWGETLDSFDSFDADWGAFAGSATLTDDGFDDGPAVTLDTDGGSRARIVRSFAVPQDFTDLDVSMAVKLHSTTRPLARVRLVMEDSSGTRRSHSGAIMPNATDRWLRLDMGVESDEGLDPSAVTELWVDHYAGDGETVFSVDDIRTVPKPDVGYVVLSFSNDEPVDYDVAYDVLSEYGYPGVCLPNLATVGENGAPTPASLRRMADAGWDVGGHGLQHEPLSDFSREEQARQLAENARRLREMGVVGADDPLHFRTPLGRYDTDTLDVVLDSFDTCIVGAGAVTGVNARVTDPRTVGFRSSKNLETAKTCIDAAADYRQLIGLATPLDDLDRAHVEALVEHIHGHVEAGRLKVITMSELYEQFVAE